MADTRKANIDWRLPTNDDGTTPWNALHAAVLMDLRDELRRIRQVLECQNFLAIPWTLMKIERNTVRKKRKKPVVVKRRAA